LCLTLKVIGAEAGRCSGQRSPARCRGGHEAFQIFLLLSRKGLIAHPGKNTARKLGKVQSLDPTRLLRGFPVSVSSTDRTFGGAGTGGNRAIETFGGFTKSG
jgi:hypothetical protein